MLMLGIWSLSNSILYPSTQGTPHKQDFREFPLYEKKLSDANFLIFLFPGPEKEAIRERSGISTYTIIERQLLIIVNISSEPALTAGCWSLKW
jgi:hypothetical protein